MFMILYSVGNLMMMMMFEDIIHTENVCYNHLFLLEYIVIYTWILRLNVYYLSIFLIDTWNPDGGGADGARL